MFEGDPERSAILLPGASYLPAAPLLWFTREVLQADGWSVLQVWDEYDTGADAHEWVAQRFEAALRLVGSVNTMLLVAKSLTSLALQEAAERSLPGVWLTPLLHRPEVRAGLEATSAATLLIGGTGDATWDSEFVHGLSNVEVLEIKGADHALQLARDPRASLEALRAVVERVGRFATRAT
ncbi:MAG: alpha/beta hydrolase [Acidimicrobiia bacterium]